MRDESGGGWRLNGQKTWTTRGAFCTHLFGLFRTDPEAERHRGLTYLLVPLDAEGVTVRGFGRLDGDEGFAEVFLDDVFVPDDAVLGEVDQGWGVAMATTSSERGLTLRSPGRFTRRRRPPGRPAPSPAAAPGRPDGGSTGSPRRGWTPRPTAVHPRDVTDIVEGRSPGARSSLNKICWSELDVRLHEAALDLLGPRASSRATPRPRSTAAPG